MCTVYTLNNIELRCLEIVFDVMRFCLLKYATLNSTKISCKIRSRF